MEESKKKKYLSPLRSMDFYMSNYHALLKKLKLENEVSEIEGILQRKVQASLLELLQSNEYEALVVTDLNRKIVWVNNGFNEMTGYTKTFALGKKPTFLQGEKTSEELRQEIRQLLSEGVQFNRTLVNYRKSGEEYHCHIDVIPLLNEEEEITHFLAMEREEQVA